MIIWRVNLNLIIIYNNLIIFLLHDSVPSYCFFEMTEISLKLINIISLQPPASTEEKAPPVVEKHQPQDVGT